VATTAALEVEAEFRPITPERHTMILGHAADEILWLAAAIAIAGVATGIFAGLFGVGGGAVIVPVLFEVFRILDVPEGVRMQLCVGTSLAIILPTSIRSYLAHRAKGAVIAGVVRAWALPVIVGVAVGALAAAYAPPAVFKIAFVLIAGLMAIRLLSGRTNWAVASTLPGTGPLTVYGFLIGLGSSLMGVGGGSLSTMVLTLYGAPLHNAIATSAGIGVPITIAGTIGYMLAGLPYQPQMPPLSIGFVSIIGVALMAPISSLVAPYGARLAHALPKRQLEIAFAVFLLAIAARFLVSLVWPA
jgi:uncharacterized protein